MGDRDLSLNTAIDPRMLFRYKEIATGVYALVASVWPIDSLVDAAVAIEYPHHVIHSGSMYEASRKSAEASDLADDASLDLLLVTGATKTAHFVFDVQCGGDCEVNLYEDTVTTNDGTGLLEAQMNRASTNTATVTATYTPTVAGGAEGTLLYNALVAGGTGGNAAGGSGGVRPSSEWILQVSKKYMIRLTNRAGSAKPVSVVAQWYEESV